MSTPLHLGLEGIAVAETHISHIDGLAGRLIVGGLPLEEVAGHLSVEALAALLWTGDAGRAAEVALELGRGRVRAFERLGGLGDALALSDGMASLRAALAHLSAADDALADLVGAVAVFVAARTRKSRGLEPVAPDPERGHADDLLRMIRGQAAAPAEVAALESYLTCVADHGMNASTFAARVVTSTGSDLVSALVAAVGALKGPLHGGAPGPVLDMLDAIGEPAGAEPWLRAELDAGRRIMGMGHRVYRVRDPRGAVLELAIERLAAAGFGGQRLELARAVERTAERLLAERKPDRPLCANVEFFTAVLLEALGLDRGWFSTIFAAGRAVGWCAHVREERARGRLIRPTARYTGPGAEPVAPRT